MIEIDGEEVDILREHCPEWSDCSDFSDGPGSCYDDPRAELLKMDAIQWFIDHFGEENENFTIQAFDVIIMDALDPEDQIDFAAVLYNSTSFEKSVMNALSDDGILVAQLGRSPMHRDPADESSPFSTRGNMINNLEQLGYKSLHVYAEAHTDFDAPWSYLVALKDDNLRANWYRSAPKLDIELHNRIHRTKSGKPAMHSFDVATMTQYQVPPKVFEINYCRQNASHQECFVDPFIVSNATEFREELNVKIYSPAIERHLRVSSTSPDFVDTIADSNDKWNWGVC